MKLLQCKTDYATLLVAVPDVTGVLRFPSDFSHESLYGVHLSLKPLQPIAPQLFEVASRILGRDVGAILDLCEDFADEISLSPVSEGKTTTLFVGRIARSDMQAPQEWLSLPDILRSMNKDRRRLPYMRALQVLTGALSLNTKAVDLEEIAKHLLPTQTDS